MLSEFTLGRRVPSDWRHVERYPYSAVAPDTVAQVERTLDLPDYRQFYDQGREGACVGFGSSWMMSILNRHRYVATWLWSEAKKIDEWPETQPGDNNGTSVRAAMDVLRTIGHVRQRGQHTLAPALAEGIAENRWATTVDQVRTCIANGVPVTLGTNWYTSFDQPVKRGSQWWIGCGDLGTVRGGHAVCIYRASDQLQAVGIVNNSAPGGWDRQQLGQPLPAGAAAVSRSGTAARRAGRGNHDHRSRGLSSASCSPSDRARIAGWHHCQLLKQR